MTTSAPSPLAHPAVATLSTPTRLPELDGVRGIAISLVLVWHYLVSLLPADLAFPGSQLLPVLGLAWTGVDLFFVLSGLLIGGILIDQRAASNLLAVFYTRRACRILPLYFVWLLLFLLGREALRPVLATASFEWLFGSSMPIWPYLTLTQNFAMAAAGTFGSGWLGITWSLAIEEQFYLTLPLLIRFVSPRWLPHVLVGAILAAPALRGAMYLWYPISGVATYVLTPSRADSLLLGVLGAWMLRNPQIRDRLSSSTRWLYAALLALAAGVGVFAMRGQVLTGLGRVVFGYLLIALLYFFFVLIAVTEGSGPCRRLARIAWLQKLGCLAYGAYLFHEAVLGLFHGLLLGQTPRLGSMLDGVVTVGALVATLALAQLSWVFLESRFLALGHSLRYHRGPDSGSLRSSPREAS
jgi:peptidoglycan/LPS O-acetylase OafA/YrhL